MSRELTETVLVDAGDLLPYWSSRQRWERGSPLDWLLFLASHDGKRPHYHSQEVKIL